MADELRDQPCPMCGQNKLTLREMDTEVPYFGKISLFSMNCENCNYFKNDVEPENAGEPTKWTLDIDGEDDMKIRVIKASGATIKIPRIAEVTPGPASNGYVTNVEGIFNRIKVQTEKSRDTAEDEEDRKKAKSMIKKLQDIMWGQEKSKLIILDPTGCSAIVSEKAVKAKLTDKEIKELKKE